MTDFPEETKKSEFRERIDQATDDAAQKVRDEAEAATDAVTARAEYEAATAANAADAASRQFEPGSLQAQAADHVANSLQQVAGALRDTDLNEAAGKVSHFARENPVLFLGGAALLGFAAARFLKASDPTTPARRADDADPWTGHVTGIQRAATVPASPAGPTATAYTNGRSTA